MADLEKMECPECGEQMKRSKYSEKLILENTYFDVELTACPHCRHVEESRIS